MPIGGKDAFLSKVTFRRESNWYSKTKQELIDMKTIEERAEIYRKEMTGYAPHPLGAEHKNGYIKGATEQKAIDDKRCEDSLASQRKHIIDKALELFGNYLMEIGYPDDWMRDSSNIENGEMRFRKAMDEE